MLQMLQENGKNYPSLCSSSPLSSHQSFPFINTTTYICSRHPFSFSYSTQISLSISLYSPLPYQTPSLHTVLFLFFSTFSTTTLFPFLPSPPPPSYLPTYLPNPPPSPSSHPTLFISAPLHYPIAPTLATNPSLALLFHQNPTIFLYPVLYCSPPLPHTLATFYQHHPNSKTLLEPFHCHTATLRSFPFPRPATSTTG
ncbi:hypothetical protein EJ06DRAFT_15147 [Trichodelitschia bisporula]|uniref:Uncharacterized protein n=1 Tax=Trichodelitschia bisporula TaxID=703511 RepID=A0A6G1IA20_9PEZI|nr:hypothetical protein EJ06DRAFT_15147 [Trichodelitschia bisporula]